MIIEPLPPQQLRQTCDPSQFDFETTAELKDLSEIIGQERAVEAIQFGIGIQREGEAHYHSPVPRPKSRY